MLLSHEVIGDPQAPSLVLVHGITESRHTWRPVIDALVGRYHIVAVDLRGHGESASGDAYDPISYAGDVVETCSSLGVSGPVVVGHSLGGVVASAVAALGGASAVVNVDQPLRLAGFKDALMQLHPLLTGSTEEFMMARDMMFSAMDGPLPEAERSRFMAHARPDQQVVLGTWQAVFESTEQELDATVEALAGGITVPYLAIHGIDPGPGYAEWLTALVPTATVELWPDRGHYPHLVELPRFVERLDTFVASLS